MAAYQKAWAERGVDGRGQSFADLLRRYQASGEFQKLAPSSRETAAYSLARCRETFGRMSLRQMEDRRMRRAILEWRDELAGRPRAADYAVATLRRVLSFGVDRGDLSLNIALNIEKLHHADRSAIIWETEDFEKFDVTASLELRAAVRLAACTGLRRGDLLRLAWDDVGDASIRSAVRKTQTDAVIPLLPAAQSLLAGLPRRADTVLTNSQGRAWTGDGFNASFMKAKARAGVDKRFHDLRGTAVTHFLAAGLSYDDVALIVGWSRANVEAIAARYVHRGKVVEAMLRKLKKD